MASPKTASDAVGSADPQKWAATSIEERLRLLREVQSNLQSFKDELGVAEAKTRNDRISDPLFSKEFGLVLTVLPVGNNVAASIDLYETLLKTGKMIQPLSASKVENSQEDLTDLHVFPRTYKESFLYSTRKDILRVRGEPKQVSPMEKESGIVGCLGAGNFSGALEIIKALFYDNCVVVHKPHPVNAEANKVWEKVLKPLVDHKALAFCDPDQGPQLTADKRLSKVYFTGGSKTAEIIAKSTKTPLISECGGNNPVIVVPGDWTDKEMKHQAMQIATNCKINGGAVCGRGQTIVTSKQWQKREAFLKINRQGHIRDGHVLSWRPKGV
jgi:acyl-CoA reductase-like NAD-dependent aldehyde dehydrogenase